MRVVVPLFGLIVTAAAQGQRLVPSALEIPAMGFGLFALEEFDGKLYIGGQFNSVNGAVVRNVVSWDGNMVEAVPGAFDNVGSEHVRALLAYQGGLIAAGQSASLGHIARWDGESWTMLGGGLPARVNTLTGYAGGLVAGCQNGAVMRWDGSVWQPIGSPMNAEVLALEPHQGQLYAGGAFTTSGSGQALNRIARWSGTDWVPVGSGLNAQVDCLKSDALGLLIGGGFTHTADSSFQLPRCARLQGEALTSIPGISEAGQVTGFFRHPDGKLLVGGAVSDGFEFNLNCVRAMRLYNGQLYVAGLGNARGAWRKTGALVKLVPGAQDAVIDVNDVAATVWPHPSSFNRLWNGLPGFEVPKGEGTHTVYTSSPWIRGTVNGITHQAVPWYAATGTNSYEHRRAGPLAAVMDDAFYERYHRVWKIDRAMVQHHIANWDAPGYSMPEPIAHWPGNGDAANGEPLRVAPFADLDDDGSYEPEAGEYPIIKGTHAVYSIQHAEPDWTTIPGVTEPMSLDLHVMHYAFETDNEALEHTVYVNYRLVNRSLDVYDDVRFAQFCDLDLGGCTTDDLVGCDSTRSLFFIYNGDDFDETCFGVGYGAQPPAQGVKFLGEEMRSHRMYAQDSPWPATINDLFYGLQEGQPFMNLGYPTHFQFPGGAWQDEGLGLHSRAQVAATGPFTLAPGDTLCIDLAFIYARAASGGAYASVDALKLRSDSVQAFYDALGLGCRNYPLMTSVSEPAARGNLRVYPNPATGRVTVEGAQAHEALLVTDMQGRVVLRAQPVQARLVLDASGWAPGAYVLRSGDAAIRMLKE